MIIHCPHILLLKSMYYSLFFGAWFPMILPSLHVCVWDWVIRYIQNRKKNMGNMIMNHWISMDFWVLDFLHGQLPRAQKQRRLGFLRQGWQLREALRRCHLCRLTGIEAHHGLRHQWHSTYWYTRCALYKYTVYYIILYVYMYVYIYMVIICHNMYIYIYLYLYLSIYLYIYI